MDKVLKFFKHLLIPHEDNNFRARLIHHDFLTVYLLLAFFLTFFFKNSPLFIKDVLGFATDISVEKLLLLTNQQREKNRLPSLEYNQQLSQAALEKGKDMFAKNYWAHYSPDGKTPWDFILSANYRYEYAGENLAKNFLFSQAVVDAWMNSSTHRDNILKKEYTDVGFAVVNGVLNGEETTLVVQMFSRPSADQLTAKTPAPVVNPVVNNKQPLVLSKSTKENKINLFNFSFDLTYGLIILLALVFFLDLFFAARLNIFRVNGKSLAHFIFLLFIIISIGFVIIRSGVII